MPGIELPLSPKANNHASWEWRFGFLAIIPSVYLACMMLTLRQTSHSIAEDGSVLGPLELA